MKGSFWMALIESKATFHMTCTYVYINKVPKFGSVCFDGVSTILGL